MIVILRALVNTPAGTIASSTRAMANQCSTACQSMPAKILFHQFQNRAQRIWDVSSGSLASCHASKTVSLAMWQASRHPLHRSIGVRWGSCVARCLRFDFMRRPAAFALIELLGVIPIVALLIALLLPAREMARAQAKTAMCMSKRARGWTAIIITRTCLP